MALRWWWFPFFFFFCWWHFKSKQCLFTTPCHRTEFFPAELFFEAWRGVTIQSFTKKTVKFRKNQKNNIFFFFPVFFFIISWPFRLMLQSPSQVRFFVVVLTSSKMHQPSFLSGSWLFTLYLSVACDYAIENVLLLSSENQVSPNLVIWDFSNKLKH